VIDRLREERGFTLIEMLVASMLMIIVLSATLTTLDVAGTTRVRNEQQNDSQDEARIALDSISLQLRNVASPGSSAPSTIDTASSYDLIFQTTDPSKRWVRYCLATSGTHLGTTSTASNGTLWYETPSTAFVNANVPPTAAMKATCPVDPVAVPATQQGWAAARAVSRHVTNKINGQDRPVFNFNGPTNNTVKITDIVAQLYVDYDTAHTPGEVRLATGDFLRNQNEAPTAVIIKPPTGTPGQKNWQFNGSSSTDPEGRTLQYFWLRTSAATPDTSTMPDCVTNTAANGWTCIGEGPVINYSFASTDTGSQKVYLRVIDPGQLSGYDNVTVVVS
jgi:prepilin-type N-terminal cleavage/methylation domain-containing protein